jgi:hypothetical protein
MGYDLHITRAEQWIDSELAPIALEEWLAFVQADPELRLEQAARASLPDGEAVDIELPGLAAWTSWSQHGDGNAMVYFWHFEGCIESRAIDAEVTAKLFRIAQRLGARVFGDEGEEYGADGAPMGEASQAAPRPRPWWLRLFGGAD